MELDLFIQPVDLDRVKKCAGHVRSEEIREIANTFSRNLDGVSHLLQVPRLFILLGIHTLERSSLFVEALIKDQAYLHWPESEKVKRKLAKTVERLAKKHFAGATFRKKEQVQTEHQLRTLLEDTEIQDALRILVFSVISMAWTSFECLAKDTWESALNARPLKLSESAFSTLERDDSDSSINRRSISVGLLARFGFDLRSHIGTVLAPKFDFTSVQGIRKAYEAAFGVQSLIAKPLKAKSLSTLEVARHVIVHRAGRIDSEYLRRTQNTVLPGAWLEVKVSELSESLNATADAGIALFSYVDSWLLQNPPKKIKTER